MRRAVFSLLEKDLVVLIYEQDDLVNRTNYILTWNLGMLSFLEENNCNGGIIFRKFQEYLHKDIAEEMKTAYIDCLTRLICLLFEKEGLADHILLLKDTLPEMLFSSLVNNLRSKHIKGIALRECIVNDIIKNNSERSVYDSIIRTINHKNDLIKLTNPISLGIIHNSIRSNLEVVKLIEAATDLPVTVCLDFNINKNIFNVSNNTLVLVGIINDKIFEVLRLTYESPPIGRDEYQIILEFIEGWVGKLRVIKNGRLYNSNFIAYPNPVLMT